MKRALSSRYARATAAVVALLAALTGVAVLRHHRAPSTAPAASRALRFAYDWPRGATYTYGLAWHGESRINVGELGGGSNAGAELTGRVDLAGDIVLRSYGKRGDTFLLSARFERVSRHELVILGRPAMPSDESASATLSGQQAFLSLDATGGVREIAFTNDAPPVFRYLMRTVALLMQANVRADGDARWSVMETTPVGRGVADYDVEELNPPRLQRNRHPYDEVFGARRALGPGDEEEKASASIALDPRGHLVSLDEHESLAVRGAKPGAPDDIVGTTSFALTLRSTGAEDPAREPDLSAYVASSLELSAPSEKSRATLLDQRVAGMTREDLERDLLAVALSGSAGDKDWLLRGSGLLKQKPELCMDLVTLFEDPRMNDRGRAQILDLLAGTGTAAAQGAMREALDSREARTRPALFGALLQRFSLVSHPTRETIAYVEQAAHDAKAGAAKTAATYALGAVAGSAMRAGDSETGARVGASMVRALESSRSSDDKRTLLAAIGNLGWDGAVPALRHLAHDADPGVRAQTAWALRKNDSSEARETLLDLASDASPEVEERAFEALGTGTLGSDDFATLAKLVASGGTSPRADSALLGLLSANPQAGAPVASMLQTLLARNDADKAFAAQIRHVLAEVR